MFFNRWFWALPFKRYNHEAALSMWLLGFLVWISYILRPLLWVVVFAAFVSAWADIAWIREISFGFIQNEMVFVLIALCILISLVLIWTLYYSVANAIGERPENFFKWAHGHRALYKTRLLLERCDCYVDRKD